MLPTRSPFRFHRRLVEARQARERVAWAGAPASLRRISEGHDCILVRGEAIPLCELTDRELLALSGTAAA